MQHYSQQDPSWAGELLGSSPTDTIGMDGCTITCIGNYADLTPHEVNELLKANDNHGYVQNDLVNWTTLNDCIPHLVFVTKQPYNNDDAVQAINNFGAVIVQVTLKNGGSHFVLYIGNEQMIDPWDGQVKGTGTYPNVVNMVILRTVVPPESPQPPEVTVTLSQDQKNALDVLQSLLEANSFGNLEGAARAAVGALQDNVTLKEQVAKLTDQVTQLTTQVKTLENNTAASLGKAELFRLLIASIFGK